MDAGEEKAGGMAEQQMQSICDQAMICREEKITSMSVWTSIRTPIPLFW